MWRSLQLTVDPHRNVDESEYDGISTIVQDAVVDILGNTVKRPGLTSQVDLGTGKGVDGLYWWDELSMMIAVSDGKVFRITTSAGAKTTLTGGTLLGSTRASLTSDANNVYIANRGKINYNDGVATTLTILADQDAPTRVSHIGFLDTFVLANDLASKRVYFSDPTDGTAWNASSFFSAESQPDPLTSMYVGWREILLGGNRSAEFFYDDGLTPFSRVQSGVLSVGIIAPYSVAQVGDSWMWVNNFRQVVRMSSRTPQVVSGPIDKQIQEMASVDDGFAWGMVINGWTLYVLTFPNANRTFVYHVERNAWTEWGYWNTNTATYLSFRGNCYAYSPLWNQHMIGDRSNGKVYLMSASTYNDGGDDIRSFRRTGFRTHNTYGWKRASQIRVRLKRGDGLSGGTAPKMIVRWRDNGGGFGNDHVMSLGAVGNREYIARLHKLGRYRTRQYEFIHSDTSPWILMDGEEDIEFEASADPQGQKQ